MAERIILDGAIVRDPYTAVADDEALPPGPALVTYARWQRERDALALRPAEVGVVLPNTVDVRSLVQDLPHWSAIALCLPGFKDGRAYSQARILRDQLGWRGQLRATGEVLRDQLFYLQRVGFNAFEVPARKSLEDTLLGLRPFTVTYQPAADEARPHFLR